MHILAPLLRMRVHLKGLLCVIIVVAFFTTVSYWTKCSDSGSMVLRPPGYVAAPQRGFLTKYGLQGLQKEDVYAEDAASFYSNGNSAAVLNSQLRNDLNTNTFEEIECLINGEHSVSCRREGREVYVPFSFLHKYFEIYGKLVPSDGGVERFEWQHSYSRYYMPKDSYDPHGVFMHFENYNVEARDRVKCISAIDGVPVSTQWDAKGYYYPIQIAQFGLSHFSKNLTDSPPRIAVYEDGEAHRGRWIISDGLSQTTYRWDRILQTRVLTFDAPESLEEAGIVLRLDQAQDYILSVDFRFTNNGSFTLTVEDREHQERYYLHYVCSQTFVMADGPHAYYGIGLRTQWSRITRDISIDFRKGLVASSTRAKGSKGKAGGSAKIKLLYLTLRGAGALDNLTLSSSAHRAHFFDAADWLLRNQDDRGGWPIPVERKFSSAGMANLQPGWYSAMAQGQAISVLTRAYRTTRGDMRYLEASLQAVDLLRTPSEDQGVRTTFLDKYVWYEEYPTIPSSFVLNGFMYALLGLYDLRMTCATNAPCSSQEISEVTQLFDDGMKSLKKMLPLFDSGATSIYDLRHFTLGVAPNLARWDYHTTHIDQLLLLATLDPDPILKTMAQRWIEYMKGKRAPHN